MIEEIITLQKRRLLAGQCPNDGNEAAPYRLCHTCRQKIRFGRALKNAAKKGVFKSEKTSRGYVWSLPMGHKNDPAWQSSYDRWVEDKRSENMGLDVLPDDGRYKPRLRGIKVDVEKALLSVINNIGRPCTIEEIMGVWGKLREQRHAPLANDLARLIKAEDRRKNKLAKAAKIAGYNA